jgi:hypothetical protein
MRLSERQPERDFLYFRWQLKLNSIYIHLDPLYTVYLPEQIESSIYKPFYDGNTGKF